MFFNGCSLIQLKKINRLRKEMNRLISKGTSNIYLNVTIEKKWFTQNLDFKSIKRSSPGQFLGELQLTLISLNSQTSCCNLKIRDLGAKLCVAFLLFSFWKKLRLFKVKSPWFLFNKNINFNKNETEMKMENPTQSFRELNHVLHFL